MTATLLALLAENPQGLTLAQIPEDARRELGLLLADGRVTLDTSSGVDVYRLGTPKEAPKPKAAPTSRMVPIALLDGLADALDEPRGTLMSDLVKRVETLREQLDAAIATAPARLATLDGVVVGTWAAPTLPAGWRARYERTAPSGVDLAVAPNSAGWSWSIIDGSQTLARGVVEVDDPTKAIGCCDAVAAVLA